MRALRLFAVLAAGLALAACHSNGAAKANLKAADAFMKDNAAKPGVVTLPSGLEYKIVTSGPASGQHPAATDEVKVNYEGKLMNGTIFDSSFQRGEPGDFQVSALVPGWTEALQLMRPGDEWILYIPPKLGYGEQDAGPIPPNSVLIFRLQLVDMLHHPASLG